MEVERAVAWRRRGGKLLGETHADSLKASPGTIAEDEALDAGFEVPDHALARVAVPALDERSDAGDGEYVALFGVEALVARGFAEEHDELEDGGVGGGWVEGDDLAATLGEGAQEREARAREASLGRGRE